MGAESVKKGSEKKIRRFFKALFARKIVIVGFVGMLFFVFIAVFADVLAPYDPNETDFMSSLSGMSREHLLGTDSFGRDTLSRIIYGSRVSLMVGVVSVLVAAVIGTLLGTAAAYFGGWCDTLIMRFCEALYAIPGTVLSLSLIAVFGGGFGNLALILGLTSIPGFIRMMRSSALSVKGLDYVVASRLQGNTGFGTMVKHIIPNAVSPIIVMSTQMVAITIMIEAGLSFMGVGIIVPTASWGSMINDSRNYIMVNPIYALAPGAALALLSISLNILGDGIRDAMDPRLNGEL